MYYHNTSCVLIPWFIGVWQQEKTLSHVEEIITLQKTPITSIREEGEVFSKRTNMQNWGLIVGFLLTSAKQQKHAFCAHIFEGK